VKNKKVEKLAEISNTNEAKNILDPDDEKTGWWSE